MTKRVLITGVSSGIGLAQARLFLEKGYQVYGVDQGADPRLPGAFHFMQRDLTLDLEPICAILLEFWTITNPYWNNLLRKSKRFLRSIT